MEIEAISVIVPAAGRSSRLGEFKPLRCIGAKTMLEHIISLYRSVGVENICVVVGHRADEVASLCNRMDVSVEINPNYANGMFSSIVKGLSGLSSRCSAFFVHPVDMPLVRRQTVLRLVEFFRMNSCAVCYPKFEERRGHPPLVSAHLLPAIKNWKGDDGLRGFFGEVENQSCDVEVVDRFTTEDIDTPQDLERALSSLKSYEIPSESECRAILKRAHVLPQVDRHCDAVARLAGKIAEALQSAGYDVCREAVIAAARLHDLARGKSAHARQGACMLRDMGFSRIADIVEVHMDFEPISGEALVTDAEVVYLADKCIVGDCFVGIERRFDETLRLRGVDPAARQAILQRKSQACRSQRRVEALLGYSLDRLEA
ncbi:DVU_1551 family NTP transferase [Desulfatirhabdium butyrativorans]|uniref:DVU_1551 family NTP transferase n=1 Tax=Desulfatirhabdium butyrativorans TaxID=340467 RepID=UPI000417054C|nr:NTP transferase domain-containing protein [Desulfatirhabdium butyrativorans]